MSKDSVVHHLHGEPLSIEDVYNEVKDECKEVIAIGVLPNHKLIIANSGTTNIYEVVGLIERAKQCLLDEANREAELAYP